MDIEGRRAVTKLAREEAARFGHDFVASYHFLIALAEPPGVAARVLAEQGLGRQRLRDEVERRLERGTNVSTGRQLPFTPSFKRALERAVVEAQALGHEVGPEHVLLGMFAEPESVAAQILVTLGLALDSVRERVVELAVK
jgi:ATP-dependent Clp protease ATP-binding subunit ClpC